MPVNVYTTFDDPSASAGNTQAYGAWRLLRWSEWGKRARTRRNLSAWRGPFWGVCALSGRR